MTYTMIQTHASWIENKTIQWQDLCFGTRLQQIQHSHIFFFFKDTNNPLYLNQNLGPKSMYVWSYCTPQFVIWTFATNELKYMCVEYTNGSVLKMELKGITWWYYNMEMIFTLFALC